MSVIEDIAKIIEQEKALVFPQFDEAAAFAIGTDIRAAALAQGLSLIVDIRLWDRPLFYCALPGTTADNAEWARRKANVVRRFQKSTYRMVLELQPEDRLFSPGRAIDPKDYVLAGGGFPVTLKGAGVIGAVTVSGLPERQDHATVVAAICAHLGLDPAAHALAPQ